MPGANFATISPYIAATLKPSGVFAGCSYVLNGEQKFSRYWPTGTSANGYSDVKFFIITDPNQTYYIQCSLSLSANELMVTKNYNVTVSSTASSGNTTTGQSSYYLLAESGAETELAARVIGKLQDDGEKIQMLILSLKFGLTHIEIAMLQRLHQQLNKRRLRYGYK